MLLNWLIKLLGGFTAAEILIVEKNAHNQIELAQHASLRSEQSLWEVLRDKDTEIQRLSNLIFKEHGVIQPEQEKRDPTEFKPMHKRMSWRERQKELQQKDAREQADRIQAQWEKKNAS